MLHIALYILDILKAYHFFPDTKPDIYWETPDGSFVGFWPREWLDILGVDEDSYCLNLQKKVVDLGLTDTTFFFPQQPFRKLPEFLSVVNVVAIPQCKRAASYGQVPAKLFDAMAMAKPIIATNIADIPGVLGECGYIVEPEDHIVLAETIKYVFQHRGEAQEKGRRARNKCRIKYSWKAMENELVRIIEKILS